MPAKEQRTRRLAVTCAGEIRRQPILWRHHWPTQADVLGCPFSNENAARYGRSGARKALCRRTRHPNRRRTRSFECPNRLCCPNKAEREAWKAHAAQLTAVGGIDRRRLALFATCGLRGQIAFEVPTLRRSRTTLTQVQRLQAALRLASPAATVTSLLPAPSAKADPHGARQPSIGLCAHFLPAARATWRKLNAVI